MVRKSAALAKAAKKERQAERRKLGSLRDNKIQPATLKRYEQCVESFFQWLTKGARDLPGTKEETDVAIGDRLEELWEDGSPVSEAGDLISGMIHFEPSLSKNLPESWKLLNVWQNNEMPARAAPVWLDLV